jgi:hypothetical protein
VEPNTKRRGIRVDFLYPNLYLSRRWLFIIGVAIAEIVIIFGGGVATMGAYFVNPFIETRPGPPTYGLAFAVGTLWAFAILYTLPVAALAIGFAVAGMPRSPWATGRLASRRQLRRMVMDCHGPGPENSP